MRREGIPPKSGRCGAGKVQPAAGLECVDQGAHVPLRVGKNPGGKAHYSLAQAFATDGALGGLSTERWAAMVPKAARGVTSGKQGRPLRSPCHLSIGGE